jgi:hypothetical protein
MPVVALVKNVSSLVGMPLGWGRNDNELQEYSNCLFAALKLTATTRSTYNLFSPAPVNFVELSPHEVDACHDGSDNQHHPRNREDDEDEDNISPLNDRREADLRRIRSNLQDRRFAKAADLIADGNKFVSTSSEILEKLEALHPAAPRVSES